MRVYENSFGVFVNRQYCTEQSSIGTAVAVGIARLEHYQDRIIGPVLVEVENAPSGDKVEVNALADSLEAHTALRFSRQPQIRVNIGGK